jgi:hypothetical protein
MNQRMNKETKRLQQASEPIRFAHHQRERRDGEGERTRKRGGFETNKSLPWRSFGWAMGSGVGWWCLLICMHHARGYDWGALSFPSVGYWESSAFWVEEEDREGEREKFGPCRDDGARALD